MLTRSNAPATIAGIETESPESTVAASMAKVRAGWAVR
jgi:hypothetical protein